MTLSVFKFEVNKPILLITVSSLGAVSLDKVIVKLEYEGVISFVISLQATIRYLESLFII